MTNLELCDDVERSISEIWFLLRFRELTMTVIDKKVTSINKNPMH